MRRYGGAAAIIGATVAAMGACVGDQPAGGDASDAGNEASDAGNVDQDQMASDAGVDTGLIGDVHGTVIDTLGRPVANANVRIGTASVTTLADGQFHFADVAPTYELDVVAPGSGSVSSSGPIHSAVAFLGVTTRTVQVVVPWLDLPVPQITLSGTYTNIALPLGANDHIGLMLMPPNGLEVAGFTEADPSGSNYSNVVLNWAGAPNFTGTLEGLAYTMPASSVTAFNGYVSDTITTTADASITSHTTTFHTLTTSTLTGSVTNSPGGSVDVSTYYVIPATNPLGRAVPSGDVTTTDGGFSLPVPNGSGVTIALYAVAAANNGSYTTWKSNLNPTASNVTLAFASPMAHTKTPVAASTGVSNTTNFSWTATAGTPVTYVIHVECGAPKQDYAADLYTTATSLTLPDFAPLGLSLPHAEACDWRVTSQTNASVDSMAGPNGYDDYSEPGAIDTSNIVGPESTFTTE